MVRGTLLLTVVAMLGCGGLLSSPRLCKGEAAVPLTEPWKSSGLIPSDATICKSNPDRVEFDFPKDDVVQVGDRYFAADELLKKDGWTLVKFDETHQEIGYLTGTYRKGDVHRRVVSMGNGEFDTTELQFIDEPAPPEEP